MQTAFKMAQAPLMLDQSIQKLDILFKFSGMNVKNQIKTPLDFLKYRWLYTFNSLWVFSAVIACFYYIITGILKGKNFVEVTSVAPCLTFSNLAMIKSLFHLIYEDDIFRLINGLRELEIKENERKKYPEKEDIIRADIGFLNTVINVLYFLNGFMIVVFDMTPLLLIVVKYVRSNEFEMLLPYLDVFSFISREFKYWPFAYIHQVWSECVVLLQMGAADCFFFTCCTHIRMQFRLLKHDFEKVIPEDSISLEGSFELRELRSKITELVQWHQDLIVSSNRLEIIYSKSNLFNFLSSSLVICLNGFNVTIIDDIVVVVTFMTFLFMGLMQVFFLCFFADMVMNASAEVSDAVYSCRWYFASRGVCKDLLLIQTRAQNPCKLTASGFADVNLRAFMRVLSTSWSYFALLRTVYGATL